MIVRGELSNIVMVSLPPLPTTPPPPVTDPMDSHTQQLLDIIRHGNYSHIQQILSGISDGNSARSKTTNSIYIATGVMAGIVAVIVIMLIVMVFRYKFYI